MDQLLEMAKDMGEAIQLDNRFLDLQMAQAKADEGVSLDEAFSLLEGSIGT